MKVRHCLVLIALLALVAPASAQELGFGGWGPRVGASNNPDQVFAGLHFNFGEFAPHLRFQPNFEIAVGDDHQILSVTAPIHYRFDVQAKITPYAGGGVTVGLDSEDRPRGGDETDLEIALKGIGGVEWPLAGGNDFFLELNVGFGDLEDFQILAGWMFGSGGKSSPQQNSQP